MRTCLIVLGCLTSLLMAGACRSKPREAQTDADPAVRSASPPHEQGASSEAEDPDADKRLIVAHGAGLYARMCAVCHGERGEGHRADQAPSLSQQDFLASVNDDFLARAIALGRPGTTMSAWANERGGPLNAVDIGSLIYFIRSWQTQPAVSLDESPARGDATKGRVTFEKHCVRCHGPKGPEVRITDREWLAAASIGFIRHAIRSGRPPTAMQGFESLGGEAIEDITAYLRGLPSSPLPQDPADTPRPPPLPLGPVPLNPEGPEPIGFRAHPAMTSVDVVYKQLQRKARMVLLDARPPNDYVDKHIAGAVSVPFYDPGPYLKSLPKDTWLVCYCWCPHAESGQLCQALQRAGLHKVTVLDEGLHVWTERGYPTRNGEQP